MITPNIVRTAFDSNSDGTPGIFYIELEPLGNPFSDEKSIALLQPQVNSTTVVTISKQENHANEPTKHVRSYISPDA